MATGPVDHPSESLDPVPPASDETLDRRVADAEARIDQLTAELAAAYDRIAALEGGATYDTTLSLFDGDEQPSDEYARDGSDPRVLPLVLGALAVVAAMVMVLTVINGNILTPFGVMTIAATLGLAWAANRTRVEPVEVSVVRGIVFIAQGETTYRFEIRRPEVPVEMVGQPGSPGWAIRFPRRGREPFVIDASMVDPVDFVARLREYRPEL